MSSSVVVQDHRHPLPVSQQWYGTLLPASTTQHRCKQVCMYLSVCVRVCVCVTNQHYLIHTRVCVCPLPVCVCAPCPLPVCVLPPSVPPSFASSQRTKTHYTGCESKVINTLPSVTINTMFQQ